MRVRAQQVGHRDRVNNGEHTSLNINFQMEKKSVFRSMCEFQATKLLQQKKEKKNRPKHSASGKKANSLQTEKDFHTNILVSESLKNHGACYVRTPCPTCLKKRF